VAQQVSSLAADPRGNGYLFYCLTPLGRLTAEKLKERPPKKSSNDIEDLENALTQLRVEGNIYVTTNQIREILWQQQQQQQQQQRSVCLWFVGQIEFDRYWNDIKLGLLLKKCAYRRMRVREKEGKRKYCIVVDRV
jgi:hypothetical protein